MSVTLEEINEYVKNGLVSLSRHPELPLSVACYTRTCQFDRAWDEVTKVCRGLVIHDDGRIIGRGLPKFFAYGDPIAEIPKGKFYTAYDKMDGTLIHVTEFEGETLVWTKGSFVSPHCDEARLFLGSWKPREGHTALFEGIFDFNRVVVNYRDFRGLVLLGDVNNETGADGAHPGDVAEASGWHGEVVVERSSVPISTLAGLCDDPLAGENREGFVVIWPNQTGPSHRIKFKFRRYLELHRTLTHLTERRVHEMLISATEALGAGSPDDYDSIVNAFLEVIPDELDREVRGVIKRLMQDTETALEGPQRAVESVSALTARKEVAEAFSSIEGLDKRLAWLLYDGKWGQARLQALRNLTSSTDCIQYGS
jgi:RNA ligase